MRELYANEIECISGGNDINLYFNHYAWGMFYSAFIAETLFGGFCGYQLAVTTGIASGLIGTTLGATFGFLLIPALCKISKGF